MAETAVPSSRAYFDACRARVDGFVSRHFTWPGTFRLHGSALGLDVLRAPINAALSPLLVAIRGMAWFCRRAGWRRAGDWLAARRILLRTSVARKVETSIAGELLQLPIPEGAAARDPDMLSRAILAAPQIRHLVRRRETAADAEALGRRVAGALGEYTGTRSAVSEMTVALCAIAVGALVFRALTPGMISMAPGIADALAQSRAVAAFPLGERAGAVWYGWFPVGASAPLVVATIAALVLAGSVAAAFAGILADPIQSGLGIHRRRLMRLIDTVEDELDGEGDRPFTAREHVMARALDLWDAGASVLRIFRS